MIVETEDSELKDLLNEAFIEHEESQSEQPIQQTAFTIADVLSDEENEECNPCTFNLEN